MFDLLELLEFLPDILEIGSVTKKYRENQANAQLGFETFAHITLAQHRARVLDETPRNKTGPDEEPA